MTKTEKQSLRAVLQNAQDPDRRDDFHAALRRIGEGTYGICVDCGETIAPHLLAAEPWIAYCVACQEATVAERSEPARWFDSSLFMAA